MASADAPVAIVGAGLAGLACAVHLQAAGVPAQIFEAAARPGADAVLCPRVHVLRHALGNAARHGAERVRHEVVRARDDGKLAAEGEEGVVAHAFTGARMAPLRLARR